MYEYQHTPVLVDEVLALLQLAPNSVVIDATIGGGGHTEVILRASAPDGIVIGIDRDPAAIIASRERLSSFGRRVMLHHGSYVDIEDISQRHGYHGSVNGILADLGISSYQIDASDRGFSFNDEGPLDMRFDPTTGETAEQVLRRLTTDELTKVLEVNADVPRAPQVADRIKSLCRTEQHITATMLSRAVESVLRRRGRIHPATQVFQAIRMEVNDELKNIEIFIPCAMRTLAIGGRLVIITFHSIEDRVVKNALKTIEKEISSKYRLITKHVIKPSRTEQLENRRSRSAKVRCIERIG